MISEARAGGGEDRAGAYLALRLLGAVGSVRDIEVTGIPGAARLEHRHDPVVGGAIAVGLSQPGALRAELEYTYRYRYDLDIRVGTQPFDVESNLSSHTLMLNVYYDWRWGRSWRPYVGAGIGWVRHVSEARLEDLSGPGGQPPARDTATEDALAWSLQLGLAWRLAERWDATLGYRFIHLGEVDVGNFDAGGTIEADDYYSHDLLLGLAYRF